MYAAVKQNVQFWNHNTVATPSDFKVSVLRRRHLAITNWFPNPYLTQINDYPVSSSPSDQDDHNQDDH